MDITDLVKNDPLLGQPGYFLEPQESDRCEVNGRWFGIGSTWVAPHIYYNAEMFEAEGITPGLDRYLPATGRTAIFWWWGVQHISHAAILPDDSRGDR